MVEPTEQEVLDWNNLDKVADWADLPHRDSVSDDEVKSPRGTLLKNLGAKGTQHPRVVASIPAEEYTEAVTTWQVNGAKPSAALRASAGLLGHACRIATGAQRRRAAVAKDVADYQAQKIKDLELQISLANSQQAIPMSATPIGPKRIKLATVVDQAHDGETLELSQQNVADAYDRYRNSQGGEPRPEEDLTGDQLAALKSLFDSGAPPYVDLAVWGPFGRRIQKKLKMSGLVMGADGQLHMSLLYGPPSVEEWVAGWTVFKTGAIMLGTITPSTCDHWAKMVVGYARTYGPALWPLVYQAEVRARLEHLERVRRTGAAEQAAAASTGGTHAYDPKSPWEWSLRKCADDVIYWRRELEDPAMLAKVQIARMSDKLGSDAPVEQSSTSSGTRAVAGLAADTDRSAPPPKRLKPSVSNKHHSTDDSGNLTCNRKGYPLCGTFQSGNCEYRKYTIACPKDNSRVHQCARCLMPNHGLHWPKECGNVQASTPSQRTKGKGKGGKGKGDKGGKPTAQF